MTGFRGASLRRALHDLIFLAEHAGEERREHPMDYDPKNDPAGIVRDAMRLQARHDAYAELIKATRTMLFHFEALTLDSHAVVKRSVREALKAVEETDK